MRLIYINLLAEVEQAEQARARDPIKLLIAISVWLLAAVVAVGGILSGLALRSNAELKDMEHQWQEYTKQEVNSNVVTYRALKQWADDILEINHSRRLCAPQLALIKDLVPNYIQLLRLSLVTTDIPPSAPPPLDSEGDKTKTMHHTPIPVQLVILQLEGKVISVRPEEDVAKFRRILETDPKFSAQIRQVQLRSYGRIASPAERGGAATGQFVIDCQYKEHP